MCCTFLFPVWRSNSLGGVLYCTVGRSKLYIKRMDWRTVAMPWWTTCSEITGDLEQRQFCDPLGQRSLSKERDAIHHRKGFLLSHLERACGFLHFTLQLQDCWRYLWISWHGFLISLNIFGKAWNVSGIVQVRSSSSLQPWNLNPLLAGYERKRTLSNV